MAIRLRGLLLFVFCLYPAGGRGQGVEAALLFEEGDMSVRRHDSELQVRIGDQARVLHVGEGELEVSRVMLDSNTPALYLWAEDTTLPLLVAGDGNIEMIYATALAISHLRAPRFAFPGDGTVRIADSVERPCSPSRVDLVRTRRERASPESLVEIDQNAERWTQRRAREVILRRVERRLVQQVPHFRFLGAWGRCEARAVEGATRSAQEREEQRAAPFVEGEPVVTEADFDLQVHQAPGEDGTLRIRWRGLEAFVAATPRAWPSAELTAREVTVSRGVRGLFLSARWHAGEDWYEHDSFLWLEGDGAMQRVMDSETTRFFDHYDKETRFPGDGTVRITRAASRECRPSRASMRRWHRNYDTEMSVEEAAREADNWVQRRSVERILRVDGGRFVHASPRWRAASAWGRCEGLMFAACPFVDVLGPMGATRIGEILRSTEYAPSTQSLVLPESEEVLVLRVSEEKAETTFLDAIHVVVGGVAVRPESCAHGEVPAYCVEDGEYFVLEEGDAIELRFLLGGRADTPEVVATGFYEPDVGAPPSARH